MITQRITQAMIAKHASVSRTAVSIALSSRASTSLSMETREHILSVAEELGYIPRLTSLMSSENTNGNLTLVFQNSLKSDPNDANYYYLSLLHTGVVVEAERSGCRLSLSSMANNKDIIPQSIQQGETDGIIVEMRCRHEWIQALRQYAPIVLLNFPIDDPSIDAVMPDNAAGIRKLVSYLSDLGHRRIAIFGMEPNSHHFSRRLAAYRTIITERGLPFSEQYIAVSEPKTFANAEVERCAAKALECWLALPAPPTAVIGLNDIFALRIMHAAKKKGLSIPRDLSVVGFDNNLSICQHSEPTLTTIDHNYVQMGQLACRLLIDRLAHPDRPSVRLHVDVPLIIRESAGFAPA